MEILKIRALLRQLQSSFLTVLTYTPRAVAFRFLELRRIFKISRFRTGLVLAATLVAVAILAIATVVLASIISNGTGATKVARDYLVA